MLTVKSLDAMRLNYIYNQFVEEYGIKDSTELLGDLCDTLNERADMWGISIGNEMCNYD